VNREGGGVKVGVCSTEGVANGDKVVEAGGSGEGVKRGGIW